MKDSTGKKKRTKKYWSYSAGGYGHTVRVFSYWSSPKRKRLYGSMRDPSTGKRPEKGLDYLDTPENRKRAIAWAEQQAAQFIARGFDPVVATALAHIFALYEQYCTVKKVPSEQQADRRRIALWTRFLGAMKILAEVTLREWQEFIEVRTSGAIDPRGNPVPPDKRKPVRDGTTWGDLVFLKTVIHWARKWIGNNGERLLREDPTIGFPMPKEKNPRQPIVTHDYFEKIRAVAEQVKMVVGRGKKRRETRSYLPELIDLADGTGHRISAILAVRGCDLVLNDGPHGSIRWPADTDKMGKEWLVPMSEQVRSAIDRVLAERPVIGAAYLFPSPVREGEPLSKEIATRWHEEARVLAGLPKLDGGVWHPYRRKWATERKHLPIKDVMAAGGWSEPTSLQACYQQADQQTMYRVMSEPIRLREAR